MEHRATHEEYYRAVNKTAGVRFGNMAGGISLKRVKDALANGDKHLNTIPLTLWDRLAIATEAQIGPAVTKHDPHMAAQLKPGSYAWSLSDGVCAWKQAARDAAMTEQRVVDRLLRDIRDPS